MNTKSTIRQATPLVIRQRLKKLFVKQLYEDLKRISGIGKKKRGLTLQEQFQKLINDTAKDIDLKTKNQLQGIALEVNAINQKLSKLSTAQSFEIIGRLKSDIDEINKSIVENQNVIDGFINEKND